MKTRFCVLLLLLATVASGQDNYRSISFHVSRVRYVTMVGPDGKTHPTTLATGWTKESTLVNYVMSCAASPPDMLCDTLVPGQAYKAEFHPFCGAGVGYGTFSFPVGHPIQGRYMVMPYIVMLAEQIAVP